MGGVQTLNVSLAHPWLLCLHRSIQFGLVSPSARAVRADQPRVIAKSGQEQGETLWFGAGKYDIALPNTGPTIDLVRNMGTVRNSIQVMDFMPGIIGVTICTNFRRCYFSEEGERKKSMCICPSVPSRMNVMAFRSAHMSVRAFGAVLLAVSLGGAALAQGGALGAVMRKGRTISLEPYAPNILRVTISIDKAAATGDPGYGFVAKPSADGWTHKSDAEGSDVFRSARMVVRVGPENLAKEKLPQPMPLDALNLQLREHYFGGGGGGTAPVTMR